MPNSPEKSRAYYLANREAVLARNRKWVSENRQAWNAYLRKRYRKNIESERARCNEYYHRDPDAARSRYLARAVKCRKKAREYRKSNRDKINAYFRDLYHRDPKRREYHAFTQKRRAGYLVVVEKWGRIGGLCYICGRKLAKKRISIDHVYPRKHGGEHSKVNLMPTHSRCNSMKSARVDYPVRRPDLVEVANAKPAIF